MHRALSLALKRTESFLSHFEANCLGNISFFLFFFFFWSSGNGGPIILQGSRYADEWIAIWAVWWKEFLYYSWEGWFVWEKVCVCLLEASMSPKRAYCIKSQVCWKWLVQMFPTLNMTFLAYLCLFPNFLGYETFDPFIRYMEVSTYGIIMVVSCRCFSYHFTEIFPHLI